MKKKLLLVGGGGHCRSIIDSLDADRYTDIAIIDEAFDINAHQIYEKGVRIIGKDLDAPSLFSRGYTLAVIALGSVGDMSIRIRLFERYKSIGFEFPAVIDPTAIVSKNAIIGDGVFIGKGSIVNTGVKLGLCAIVNTGAIIEHDCHIGDFVHIGPKSCLSGGVLVGNGCHIGIGSTVIQSIQIGEKTIIGAGSIVIRNIPPNCTAVGAPAVPIKLDKDS